MRSGLERLLDAPRRWLGRARVGLVANPTTVDRDLHHAVDRMHAHPEIDLRLLFGPEHGIRGAAQDMVDVGSGRDSVTRLPEISLYGTTFASLSPRPEHLSAIDILVFDVQDVGARYYTYAATMALCMRAARQAGIAVVVLDRPNPIGGLQIEGGGLETGLENFCGLYPVPQRHAMTVGELARLYNDTFGIGCQLEVVACEGWRREAYYDASGLPWVMPSPFIDARALGETLATCDLGGVRFRPCVIEPAFHKFAGQRCGALQLHVTDRRAFNAYRTGIAVLLAVRRLWPHAFAWRTAAYEFRDDVPAIDLLTGKPAVRHAIEAGEHLDAVMRIACTGTEAYTAGRERALLYE
jgi:uncharacterized protein YbbC (DUF1343 family)